MPAKAHRLVNVIIHNAEDLDVLVCAIKIHLLTSDRYLEYALENVGRKPIEDILP